MKKKVFAAVLAASMLMMTACNSTKETTLSSNSETEATTTTTAAITTESEIQTEAPTSQALVPLFFTSRESELRQKSPDSLFIFTNFAYYFFPLSENGRTFTVDKNILYDLSYGNVFSISADPVFGEGYERSDVEICFFERNELGVESTVTGMYYKLGDTESSIDFVPYYYNPSKGCLVGYYKSEKNNEIQFVLSELYYAPDTNRLSPSTVSDSEYDSYFKAT